MNQNITREEARCLYEENIAYIYKASLFLTKSKVMAEDISQEVFLKAFEKYGTFDQSKPIKPWLYQIMLNMVRTQCKKKKRYIFWNEVEDEVISDDVLIEHEILR
ncbi:MAG: RNA polymerase sigma factor, partial [Cellulosilyticum sp.]|nr:RNA polymerase sigma factor [Cellulosilyticum sp.]